METILEKLAAWPTQYLTIEEASEIIRVGKQCLYKKIRQGRFRAVRVFGTLKIDPAHLAAWLQQRGA